MKVMENNSAISIKNILSKDNYIIPIYQRNYAWGKAEISQLIRDIKEYSDKGYYLGSLVCFKRENGDYELIDGQQRHTTISLINAVLKNFNGKDLSLIYSVSSTNLKFDSRKNVQRFLEELHSSKDFEQYIENVSIPGIQGFKDAIGFIREEFNEEKFDIIKFAEHFYNNVKLFRVEVPQDTDLNHYFEIMNSRGEQLEKHEIVKANLMGEISDKSEQEKFAIIWDACSDMSNYVWFNFDSKYRSELINFDNLNENTFDKLFCEIEIKNEDKENSLLEILDKYILSENFPNEEKDLKEKYKSVIDFPNFLLQVLKIKYNSVSLDDKKLLNEFSSKNETGYSIDSNFSKEFIINLLKYRIKFDKYIIKQALSDANEIKQNWKIGNFKLEENGNFKSFTPIKTFEDDEELVNMQTMLYYSNPSNTNNNWVYKILKEKYFENEIKEYTKEVFEIAKNRYDNKYLSYPEITIFNLYFIDFLLWKLYKNADVADSLKELKNKIEKVKSEFNSFKFKQLNSKEHLFPQSKASGFDVSDDDLNGIGNLCLISTSQNSSGNKDLPEAKKKSFWDDNSSLKRLIMFESFDDEKWGTDQIQKHEKEIQELLKPYL